MTNWFVDSSVLIRAINGDSPAAHRWFTSAVKDGDTFLGSRLLEVEVLRYAVNTESDISRTQEYLDRFSFIEITKDVIAAAIAISVPLGGADSIHVSSALRHCSNQGTPDATHALGLRVSPAEPSRPPQHSVGKRERCR